jgi:hypothetical protein
MSYSSRVYRRRNPNTHEELKQKSFFAGKDKHEKNASSKKISGEDSFEREADSVANAVMSNPQPSPGVRQQKISNVQRLATSKDEEKTSTNEERMKQDKDVQEKSVQLMESPEKKEDQVQKTDASQQEEDKVQRMNSPKGEEEKVQKADDPKMEEDKMKDKGIQTKEEGEPEQEEKESTTPVQPKLNNESGETPQATTRYLRDTKGKGSPLSKDLLHEMNAKLGYDFSGVRIHDDSEAHGVCKEFHAQAFTHGQDIYFDEGKFDPQTAEGRFLLAHELTHVIQQTGGDQNK